MSKYPRISTAFFETPWAIEPAKLVEIQRFLVIKFSGGEIPQAEIDTIVASRRDPGNVQRFGRVAVVNVFGAISQRASGLEEASGGVSAEKLAATVEDLADQKDVGTIVMNYDSPGGSVYGIPEAAARIRAVAAEKKVVALANPVAASGAYWLAAQAREVYVIPSGQVGSVGVLMAHEDYTKAEEMRGIKTTLIGSSEYKTEGYPTVPLTESAVQDIQAKVAEYYGMFVRDLAKGRGVSEAAVRSDFGKGRMLLAKAAVDAKMVDGIATFEQLVKRLGGGAVAEVERMEAHVAQKRRELSLL